MIDIKYIRENPQKIQDASLAKGVKVDIDALLKIDGAYRELAQSVQKVREERNAFTKTIKGKPTPDQVEKGKQLKEQLDKEEASLRDVEAELKKQLLQIPNPAKPDVKVGKDDSENEVIKIVGEPTKFTFKPKDHLELGEYLDIIDTKQAAKVSGARFAYLKNDGALLEYALRQFAFDTLLQEGFIPVVPPVMIRKSIMEGLGYTAMGEADNIFEIEKEDLYLVGTSEQSVVPLHMDDCLPKKDLPRRYVSFSPCFRREAGSYGKDTRGIWRVHQFNKVEMVSFVEEGQDDHEHEYFLELEEKFFQQLGLPYQVLRICTGDLGFNAARKYDIEAWLPSQQKYGEVTSTSTVTDFQSRRLNMKYQDGEARKYLNVVNGTAFSMNRPIVAILENFQQEDGTVVIPEVLRKYMGKDEIVPQNRK